VLIRRGREFYRDRDGRIPAADVRNPAFLRLALVKNIAQEAAAARAEASAGRGVR